MESFIDKLNSTLNAANKHNESEVEEIKDEIIEDLEEEALQAEADETFEDEETRKNTIINQVEVASSRKVDYKQVKPKKTSFYINKNNGAHSNDYEDDFDDDEENSDTLKRNTDSKEDFISNMIPIGTATNHMHNRINSLEKWVLTKIINFKSKIFKLFSLF